MTLKIEHPANFCIWYFLFLLSIEKLLYYSAQSDMSVAGLGTNADERPFGRWYWYKSWTLHETKMQICSCSSLITNVTADCLCSSHCQCLQGLMYDYLFFKATSTLLCFTIHRHARCEHCCSSYLCTTCLKTHVTWPFMKQYLCSNNTCAFKECFPFLLSNLRN